jgi:dUTP pyrophosphatase
MVDMNYRRFDKNIPALSKDDERNAGFDLFARLEKPFQLYPGEVARIALNVATEIPVYGVGLVFQRSSTYKKWGIKLTNGVGVIDCLYCGDGDEWQAEFKNETKQPITIKPGDKLCQAVFVPLLALGLVEKDELGNEDRGGFGTSYDNATEVK